jgi:predicted dehydrogenase
MKSMDRRRFIKTSALASASLGLLPTLGRSQPANARVRGANEDIRVAVVGFGGRGKDHIKGFGELEGVRLVALCDVDKHILEREVKRCADAGKPVASYTDIRKLLENHEVDLVSIATPNHWHSLAAIWSMQAGKDVYVEKPVSHNVWEGRQVVHAARKYNKMCQAGTQSRSSREGIAQMVEWVKAGNLGKILIARGQCYKPRGSIGKTEGPQKVPDYIDYDLWCGPAPLDPPRRNNPRFGPIHYDWHWFWAYGCGDLGNQGIHQMDIARWFTGENALSPRVCSVGGRLGYVDDAETPNTQIVYHDYARAPLIFEVRGLPEKTGSSSMDKFPAKNGGSVCVNIHCEGGLVHVPNYNMATAYDQDGKKIVEFKGSESHYENLIKAVRSRKVSDLHADILEGHLSSALCHTGNVSYRLGRQKSPHEIRDALKSDSTALEAFGRMAEHLAANGVDLDKTRATLGEVLRMDPKTERFVGNSKANDLLTRKYRKPFVVPKSV